MNLNTTIRYLLSSGLLVIALSAGVTSSFGASFDCNRAVTPSEVAICEDPDLSDLDLQVSRAFDQAKRTAGKKVVLPVARNLLQERQQCGGSADCIGDVLNRALTIYQALGEAKSHDPQNTRQVEVIPYGSRAGMELTVRYKRDLNTAHAILGAYHSRDNAISFCRDYGGNVTEACIREGLALKFRPEITANCWEGTLVTFNGHRFEFQGRRTKGLFAVDRDIVDGASMAEGLGIAFEQYLALCPGTP